TGYLTAQEAQRDISHYLMHRYNWIRPHQFNDGLPPAVAEEKLGIRNFWLIKCQRCKEENLSQRII
ncbi:hypothetical protein ACL8ED_30235, partial [Pseudomonas aeruginosa]